MSLIFDLNLKFSNNVKLDVLLFGYFAERVKN